MSQPTLFHQLQRRAYELLRDGKWRDRERVFRELSKLVPPGVATRRTERDRVAVARQQAKRRGIVLEGTPPRHIPRSPQVLIRSGARSIVRDMLNDSRAFEIKEGQVRCVGVPSVVRGDQLRAEVVIPLLDELARVFTERDDQAAVEEVRLVAHANGMHLTRCPKGCTLTLPPEG